MAHSLFSKIVALTGLPIDGVVEHLEKHFKKLNLEPETANLDQIREVVSEYLLEIYADRSTETVNTP